ncbi:hypothetical protein BCR36DRAFT_410443 [Piromyces finnis]|uniref:BRCA2 OB1 domain-containing protein n=1 Tax=Piromyces finnis TaxID=1754191 RepID=A0A1Y1VGH6_9FUNG|nr:hypothetical protein BCR36DRAFT_410443 [Piromyces finnis]|eukprot:ORX55527.1 hypothetical protein BCR36DRAFT_410443 [Piromyces finnis]
MLNSHSEEYCCKENEIKNFDSVYIIKHNSVWKNNCEYDSGNKLKKKLDSSIKKNNEKNFDKTNIVNDEILIYLNNEKEYSQDNDNLWQTRKGITPIKNEISKNQKKIHFETPKNGKNQIIRKKSSSLMSCFPSSPSSPVYTILNGKNDYQVLWSPSMETPTLNRTISRNPSNKINSNLVSPENIDKNNFKNYESKSKSLISFTTNIPIELEKSPHNITHILYNNNTPKNNLIYDKSNLTTPDSVDTNKTRKAKSSILEQLSLFKNAINDNKYLSSPMISPDDIKNINKDTLIPYHFRNLFYTNNKENTTTTTTTTNNNNNNKNEKAIEIKSSEVKYQMKSQNKNEYSIINKNESTKEIKQEILKDRNLDYNEHLSIDSLDSLNKSNHPENKRSMDSLTENVESPAKELKYSYNKKDYNKIYKPKSPTFTDDELVLLTPENKKHKTKRHHKHSCKKKKRACSQNTELEATPKLKRTKYISIEDYSDSEDSNFISFPSTNYIRTTPKIKNCYNKELLYNEYDIQNEKNDLNELSDTQSNLIRENNKKENSKIDLLNSDSLKDIYNIFDNDSVLDLINLDDEDRKSFLETPRIKKIYGVNDNELTSSLLVVQDSSISNKNVNSNDNFESFDYGSDNIDYNMVKENHIITQAYSLLDQNNNIKERSINSHLNNSDFNDNNMLTQKENINIDNHINELTNFYNEFNETVLSSNKNKNLVNSINNIKKQKSELESDFELVLNEIANQDYSLFDEDNSNLIQEIIKKDEVKEIDKELLKSEKNSNKKPVIIYKDENDYIKGSGYPYKEITLDQTNEGNNNVLDNSLIYEDSLPMPPIILDENNYIKSKLEKITFNGDKNTLTKISENNSESLNVRESLIELENHNNKLSNDMSKPNLKKVSKNLNNEDVIKQYISKSKMKTISEKKIERTNKIFDANLFDTNEKLKSNYTIEFVGFKTGNGKQLPKLSKEAISNAKKILGDDLFDDIEMKTGNNELKSESIEFVGFKTGHGKQLPKLSKEAISNAKKILGDDLFDDIEMKTENNELKSESTEFVGFKTGNGKQLPKLSKEAISNAKKILGDDLFDDIEMKTGNNELKSESIEFVGFKTGNGKQLPKLSKEAINDARKILGDDLFDDIEMKTENNELKSESTEFVGFKTGNGKQLPKLSKEAINNAKKILGDDLFDDIEMKTENNELKSESTEFVGFKTGNGKQLPKLSKEAISNAKKILGDDLFDDIEMKTGNNELKSESIEFVGFKTGNGKQLPKLSKEAINDARKILGDDLFDDIEMKTENNELKSESTEFVGFKTGNGKQLPKLSKEAINDARKILGDDLFDDIEMKTENNELKSESTEFVGFKTGNGKQLPKLSKEAISNAKKILGDDLFDDIEMKTENNELKSESTEFVGFKTGNGKQLPKLSKEAINDARKILGDDLFDDIEMKTENNELKSESTEFVGFKTGNGKQLPKLSKEAINNAKNILGDDLFDDIEMKTENRESKLGSMRYINNINNQKEAIKQRSKKIIIENNTPKPVINQSIKIINNKIFKRVCNNNKENVYNENEKNQKDKSNLKRNKLKENNINNFSKRYISNKKSSLNKNFNDNNDDIIKPLHTINKNNSNILKPNSVLPKTYKINNNNNNNNNNDNNKEILKQIIGVSVNNKISRLLNKKKLLSNRPFKSPLIVKPIENSSLQDNININTNNQQNKLIKDKNWIDIKKYENKRSLAEIFRFLPQNFSQKHIEKILCKDIAIMNPQIALDYRFKLNNTESWGSKEAYEELKKYNVNTNIATKDWVDNHYKWIIWKIASMVRTENSLYEEYWNKEKIIEQLLYRYNKENNLRKHSALKLIIERDNISTKYMILCVSNIIMNKKNENDNENETTKEHEIYLELTDGWYSINAQIDNILQDAVKDKKIFIGQKLCISGAKLIGSNDPLPVLEVNDAVRLNLVANSTRIAKWDTKLGYQNYKSFKISLNYIQPFGGQVSMIDVIIIKKYSICYSEKMNNGSYILRNQFEEEIEEEILNNMKMKQFQNEIDNYNKLSENKSKKIKNSRKLTMKELENLSNGEDLYEEMEKYADTYYFLNILSEYQRRILNEFINEKKTIEFENIKNDFLKKTNKINHKRNVSSFLRLKICDYFTKNKKNYEKKYVYLTIWNPNIKIINNINEGKRYQIFYPKAKPENNEMKYSLSLNNLNNIFEKPIEDEIVKNTLYKPRELMPFNSFASLTIGSEIDVVAYCLAIHDLDSDNNKMPLKYICILSDNTQNFLIVEVTSNVKLLRKRQNFQEPIFIRNLKIKGFNESCNLFISCINMYTEVKSHSSLNYEKEKYEILKNWSKTNQKDFNDQKLKSEEILNYIINPYASKPIINNNIYNINSISPPVPKRNMLLHSFNNNENNKRILNKIPELLDIAKLASNTNEQLDLINKIDNRLYNCPINNPLKHNYNNNNCINNNAIKNYLHSYPSKIPIQDNNEYLERDIHLKEWIRKSINCGTFSIYAHLIDLNINYNNPEKYINFKSSLTSSSIHNSPNKPQFTLIFDNGENTWNIELSEEQFLSFISMKNGEKSGCYHSIDDNFYKDVLIYLNKLFKKQSLNISFDPFKNDTHKKKLNSIINELLKENDISPKNQIITVSFFNDIIDQLYYYGILDIENAEVYEEDKDFEYNTIPMNQDTSSLISYKENKDGILNKNEPKESNQTNIKIENNNRPLWWNEGVLNAFESFRIKLWDSYQIRNKMSKDEFIVWTIRFGKIIKDEDLWNKFNSWIQEKKRFPEETSSTINTEIYNKNYKKGTNENENIFERDDFEVFESFMSELLLQYINNNDTIQTNTIPPLLLFYEKEWDYLIKLIIQWLKESEFKLILLKEKTIQSLSNNLIHKFVSIHRINNDNYLNKLLNELT